MVNFNSSARFLNTIKIESKENLISKKATKIIILIVLRNLSNKIQNVMQKAILIYLKTHLSLFNTTLCFMNILKSYFSVLYANAIKFFKIA